VNMKEHSRAIVVFIDICESPRSRSAGQHGLINPQSTLVFQVCSFESPIIRHHLEKSDLCYIVTSKER